AADPTLADVAIATDNDGDPIRSDGVRSSGVLVVAFGEDENGDDIELRYYIEVRAITNQPDGLLIIHRAPAESYTDEIGARTKITTTIVYPTR
ncbi:MAG TPA: hypothetical protein PK691_07005, partial [Thermomicrobiales bacterium]|nr:hypothetical protein [Thermomicrobiales bacterium]